MSGYAPFPSAMASFEAHAEAFYRETGIMAPGKSVPLEMSTSQPDYETRHIKYAEWIKGIGDDCAVCAAKRNGSRERTE